MTNEINKELERFGLPMRCAAVPVRKNVFPTSCSDCGANFFHNPYQDTARCNYCKAIILPLKSINQSPEAREANAANAANAAQSANSNALPHLRRC